jgi:hypothetical protein
VISARPCPQVCTGLNDLCFAGPRPQGLPCLRYTHPRSLFCWAVPLRPAKPGTHTCTMSILLDYAQQACQAKDPQTCRIFTLPAGPLQACQAQAPKVCYFTSAKGLHPKACGTPSTIHSPEKGSKHTKETHTDRSRC